MSSGSPSYAPEPAAQGPHAPLAAESCRSGVGAAGSVLQGFRGVVEHVTDTVPQDQKNRDETDGDQRNDQGIFHQPLACLITPESLPQALHCSPWALATRESRASPA